MNISKRIPFIKRLIEDNSTKILIYFSTKTAGDDYDDYEKNYTYTNLNPHSIKAYVTEISPSALKWTEFGLKEMGAKEIICEEKYRGWFENCNKIEIDGDEYEIFREATGNRAIIQKRAYRLIRVMLQKKD